ncbi:MULTISPECIES: hypothetical protein [unclassified Streptomyces]|uniref:hypothetical protein n=1 Tax=unclassified Streptomyces TaxID=2593676 RepID=UPI0009A0C4C9|nr:hypothetical protein [Streptomyces sp. CB02058]
MNNRTYRDYDFSHLPDGLALFLGILVVLMLVVLFGGLLLIGRRKSKSPEERARAAAGRASRSRQADLRKRRVALQRKADRQNP